MKVSSSFIHFLLGLVACQSAQAADQAWGRYSTQAAHALEQAQRNREALPALPAGTEELRFQDFFKPVIGDRGLEYTQRMLSLDGKRVRVAGFMVREQSRKNGVFMLAPWPTRIESDGFCVYEDYPPATLHVVLPDSGDTPVPFRPGLVIVTGTLDVKPSAMPDGRNCVACLRVDPQSFPSGLTTPVAGQTASNN